MNSKTNWNVVLIDFDYVAAACSSKTASASMNISKRRHGEAYRWSMYATCVVKTEKKTIKCIWTSCFLLQTVKNSLKKFPQRFWWYVIPKPPPKKRLAGPSSALCTLAPALFTLIGQRSFISVDLIQSKHCTLWLKQWFSNLFGHAPR